MGELGALFNPGMRHEIEERQSKASRREEEGQADPGNLRIDLLSGVAVINMRGPSDDADSDTDTDTDTDDSDTDTDESDGDTGYGGDGAARGEDHLVSGSAPEVADSVDATVDSAVDDVALRIAEETSNDEAAT